MYVVLRLTNATKPCVILSSDNSVAQDPNLRVQNMNGGDVQQECTVSPFKMTPLDCFETSVTSYPVTLLHIPEELIA
jgi:hypothetical protein